MSWNQLVSLVQEAKALAAEEEAKPPACCPHDGTALETGPDGLPFCPFDGWRP